MILSHSIIPLLSCILIPKYPFFKKVGVPLSSPDGYAVSAAPGVTVRAGTRGTGGVSTCENLVASYG